MGALAASPQSPAAWRPRPLPAALEAMKAQPRWLVWKWEISDKGKWTKVPYRATAPQRKASSTDETTWAAYAEAVAAVEAGKADGIGFALDDGEIGAFDIDDCRDPATGTIAPWAWSLIEDAQSYTEVTISGTGVRVIGLAVGAKVHRKQSVAGTGGSIETYRRAERYIVMTGDALDGYDALLNIDPLIDATVERLDAEKKAEAEARRAAAEAERQAKDAERRSKHDISRYFNQAGMPRRDDLPGELDDLIRFGVPLGQRSEKFFHAVGWLKDRGHSPAEIEALLAAHPGGIAAKFMGRLQAEVERAFDKAETRSRNRNERQSDGRDWNGWPEGQREPAEPPFILKWHGDPDDTPLKEWLVDKTLPKVGTALLSGQWGTYKTFVGFDLSACIMISVPFAGREVQRQGGVLWIAVEGQDEVRIRLVGLINEKVRPALDADSTLDPERLPFVWVEACPKLSDPDALPKLRAIAKAAADGLRDRFDLPLAMVLIDTLSPAAEFKDSNDTAENQRVMTVLKKVAREFETLVVAVDHMGKDVTTGTRNSSVKEADVDAVLALLADRDLAGNVTNPRMGIRKVRGAPTGMEIKFDKRVVQADRWGNTTLVMDWAVDAETASERAAAVVKPAWSGKAKLLKGAIERAMIDFGKKLRPYGAADGPEVKAVEREKVRAEFYKGYSADSADTKRKAFNRLMDQAATAGLISSREIAEVDWIWFARDEPDTGHPPT